MLGREPPFRRTGLRGVLNEDLENMGILLLQFRGRNSRDAGVCIMLMFINSWLLWIRILLYEKHRNIELKMAAGVVVQLLLILAPFVALSSQQIPEEGWGYVTVRSEAHMFWWLYGSTAPDRESRPLIMWLQVCLCRAGLYG